jgi:hypothetical protein
MEDETGQRRPAAIEQRLDTGDQGRVVSGQRGGGWRGEGETMNNTARFDEGTRGCTVRQRVV